MDYATLKADIQSYLYNRKDLTPSIPAFIRSAEARIYRQLRTSHNEKTIEYLNHSGNELTLPDDYLEVRLLTYGGLPLEHVSDTLYLRDDYANFSGGGARQWTRQGNVLTVWPEPENESDYKLVYYATLGGNLSADSDTNAVMTAAPDLYLHAVLVEASAYLGQDARIPVWQANYQRALMELAEQDAREHAAGPMTVKSVYAETGRSYAGRTTRFY